MRLFGLAILLLLAGPVVAARGDDAVGKAGIMRLAATTHAPFDILVWYPTAAEEVPWQDGPFAIPATRDAPIAEGPFPVVLLSHGGGLTGGTPLLLNDLSASLARSGFIVIAPFHGRSGLRARPPQIARALDTVLTHPRLGSHLDPARLGLLGFSLGGAVALQLAGAVPNPAHLVAYCAAQPDDAMSCGHAPDGGNRTVTPRPQTTPPARALPAIRAIALLDPFAVLFQRPELAPVTMPVLIIRPDQSALPGEANAQGLAASLPHPPEFHRVPGHHFVFADQCTEVLRSAAAEVCLDRPGVDRPAIHRSIAALLTAFFRRHL